MYCVSDFDEALVALKSGLRVCRKGWNGKGMFLVYVDPYSNDQFEITELPGLCGKLAPWIGMKTADDKLVPWLASQTDLLATDWIILD